MKHYNGLMHHRNVQTNKNIFSVGKNMSHKSNVHDFMMSLLWDILHKDMHLHPYKVPLMKLLKLKIFFSDNVFLPQTP